MSSVRIGAKMAFFRGFGPRRAAVWAEQPFFSFAIIFYHPKEHSLRVSALYSKIFLNYTFGLDISRSVSTEYRKSSPKPRFRTVDIQLSVSVSLTLDFLVGQMDLLFSWICNLLERIDSNQILMASQGPYGEC